MCIRDRYYTCTTAGAIVLAMFLANLFKGFFTVIDPTGVTFEPGETASFMDTLVDIFPSNRCVQETGNMTVSGS